MYRYGLVDFDTAYIPGLKDGIWRKQIITMLQIKAKRVNSHIIREAQDQFIILSCLEKLMVESGSCCKVVSNKSSTSKKVSR
jgi:hypothetical protein